MIEDIYEKHGQKKWEHEDQNSLNEPLLDESPESDEEADSSSESNEDSKVSKEVSNPLDFNP